MANTEYSRREFSRVLSHSLALACAAPGFCKRFENMRAADAGSGTVFLNFNENPYGPTPKAMEALAACGPAAARYPDAAHDAVQAALAAMHGVKPENILLGCGSTEILRVADAAFLGQGQTVVVAETTFEAVLRYARTTRATPVLVPMTADHRHDLPKMAAACTSKAGLVYVCNPNNPTGTIVTRDQLADFARRVPATTLILVDEAYFHFAEHPHYGSVIEWIEQHPNIVVARTFSKIYGMAGMRLGYAVGSKENIAAMDAQIQRDNCNAAVLPAALASLADTDYLAISRARINATRHWLSEQLSKEGRPFIPSETNFVMLDMGTEVAPIIEQFRAHNILVGRRFPSMKNYLRVTIGTQAETEQFMAALREIAPAHGSKAA
jgi:histidinol-phosphate aminotransferase